MSESSLTIISPKTLAEARDLATILSGANSMPAALKKSPADVLAIVMAGAELGLAPMQSIRAIVLIQGRPTLSADAMGALVKASSKCEYLQCTETTEKVATFVTKRRGDPEPTRLSFTFEEAKAAGLVGKDVWKQFPKAMLRARAQSAICRLVYSDLMLGVYDSDELEAPPEKDVTPAAPTVDAMKVEMKRKMKIVDVPDVKPSPPAAVVTEDDACVGWGLNAAVKLADMKTGAVQALVYYAENEAMANVDDERDLWVERMARYQAALDARTQAVTP